MAECLYGTPVAPPGPPYEALGSGRVTGGESGRRGGEIPPPPPVGGIFGSRYGPGPGLTPIKLSAR